MASPLKSPLEVDAAIMRSGAGNVRAMNMARRRLNALDTECLNDIRRILMEFQRDPKFRGNGNRVPLRQFAELCGVSRQTLYDITWSDRKGLEPATRDRIMRAIGIVINDGLRWRRVAVRRAKIKRITLVPAIVEWRPVMLTGAPVPNLPRRQLTPAQARNYDYSNL